MAVALGPTYANVFMSYWESVCIYNLSSSPLLKHVIYWKRYIDDVLMVFDGTESELMDFRDYINSTHPTLKFSMEYSPMQIDFLDMRISINENRCMDTTIYRKPTDRNGLLHAQSHHPKHLVENIPYGQFLRLKRICNNAYDYEEKADDMHRRFRQRGYKESVIQTARDRVKDVQRESLLVPKDKTIKEGRVTFVSEYNTSSHGIKTIIRKHWGMLQCDPSLKNISSQPPRFCFKRGRNIKDSVVSSIYRSPNNDSNWLRKECRQLYGSYRCGKCTHCSNAISSKVFHHPHTGQEYKVRGLIDCETTGGTIYILKCPCSMVYVGQTKRCLKLRIAEHKAAIRNGNMDYAIARHYKERGHGSASTLRFMGIEKVTPPVRGGDMHKLLLQREAFWIFI